MTKSYTIPSNGLTNDFNKGDGPATFRYHLWDDVAGEWQPETEATITVDGTNPYIDLGVQIDRAAWEAVGEKPDGTDLVWAIGVKGDKIGPLLNLLHNSAEFIAENLPALDPDRYYLVSKGNDGRDHCTVIVSWRV